MGIPVHEAADAASPGVACAGRGVSVLMVDMPPDVAAGLQRGLRGEHLFVEFAHSLDTAGKLRERYRFDLVVANYDALGQPLADWVCRLRVDGDPTPVIFVADNLDADLAVTALRAGASDIVSADAGSGDFPSALRRVLKREKAPHPEDASPQRSAEMPLPAWNRPVFRSARPPARRPGCRERHPERGDPAPGPEDQGLNTGKVRAGTRLSRASVTRCVPPCVAFLSGAGTWAGPACGRAQPARMLSMMRSPNCDVLARVAPSI